MDKVAVVVTLDKAFVKDSGPTAPAGKICPWLRGSINSQCCGLQRSTETHDKAGGVVENYGVRMAGGFVADRVGRQDSYRCTTRVGLILSLAWLLVIND